MTGTIETKPTPPAAAGAKRSDLEIKDAQLIFGSIWRELEAEFGREHMRFPKEIILLGGAPGAGKGTNTAFIAKVRGLTCQPIVISSLLNSPEAQALKDAGNMVGDRDVVGLLLRELLREEYQDGVILDGFPRTQVQVECLKLLVDKMHALRREFYNTPLSIHFRQPTIHIMVLFVDEKESVARQLKRGRETMALIGAGRAHRRRPAAGRPADRSRRIPGPPALPRFQGANVGRLAVVEGNLPLPFHQRPGPDRGSGGEHPARTRIPEHAGTRLAHGGPAPGRARGQPDHHPRPAGTGEAARQL